eukprot:1994273-Rhodomonas_salina.2
MSGPMRDFMHQLTLFATAVETDTHEIKDNSCSFDFYSCMDGTQLSLYASAYVLAVQCKKCRHIVRWQAAMALPAKTSSVSTTNALMLEVNFAF